MALNNTDKINWKNAKIKVIKDISTGKNANVDIVEWNDRTYVRKQYVNGCDVKNMVDKINRYHGPGSACIMDDQTILMKRFFDKPDQNNDKPDQNNDKPDQNNDKPDQNNSIKPGWLVLDPNNENFVGGNLIDFDYVYDVANGEPIDDDGIYYLKLRLNKNATIDVKEKLDRIDNQIEQRYIDQHPSTHPADIKSFLSPLRQAVSNGNEENIHLPKKNENLIQYIARQLERKYNNKEVSEAFLESVENGKFNIHLLKDDILDDQSNIVADILDIVNKNNNEEENSDKNNSASNNTSLESKNEEEDYDDENQWTIFQDEEEDYDDENQWEKLEDEEVNEKDLHRLLKQCCHEFNAFQPLNSKFQSLSMSENLGEHIKLRLAAEYGKEIATTFFDSLQLQQQKFNDKEIVSDLTKGEDASAILKFISVYHSSIIDKKSLYHSLKNYCEEFEQSQQQFNNAFLQSTSKNGKLIDSHLIAYIANKLQSHYGDKAKEQFLHYVENEEFDEEAVQQDIYDEDNYSMITEHLLEQNAVDNSVDGDRLLSSLKNYCQDFKEFQKSISSSNSNNNNSNSNTFFKSQKANSTTSLATNVNANSNDMIKNEEDNDAQQINPTTPQ